MRLVGRRGNAHSNLCPNLYLEWNIALVGATWKDLATGIVLDTRSLTACDYRTCCMTVTVKRIVKNYVKNENPAVAIIQSRNDWNSKKGPEEKKIVASIHSPTEVRVQSFFWFCFGPCSRRFSLNVIIITIIMRLPCKRKGPRTTKWWRVPYSDEWLYTFLYTHTQAHTGKTEIHRWWIFQSLIVV